MFDLHQEMNDFHKEHVCLSYDDKRKLAGYRDTNLQRLKSGLDKLGEENEVEYAHPIRTCNQGSYAMHTIIQHPENDYDIDVALIFRKDDLPSTALDSRKRIEAAMLKGGGNFNRLPEARANCVTVWYTEGYHIDLAIYREYEDEDSIITIEHAGPAWTARDPMEITNWFNQEVRDRSPSGEMGADVEAGQMRRVVRLLKAFAKSREPDKLPSGLIISALVSECYSSDSSRDDVSLYQTMVAIHSRLMSCTTVLNPVNSSQELTDKSEYENQVRRLRDALGDAIKQLDVLFNTDDYSEAMQAWKDVFQHSFWSDTDRSIKAAMREYSMRARKLESLRLDVGVAKEKGGAIVRSHESGGSIVKGWHLHFSIAETSAPRPYSIRWTVKNYGPEAEEADDLGPRIDSDDPNAHVQWEHTGYAGHHTMTCELHRNGVVLARTQHVVNVL